MKYPYIVQKIFKFADKADRLAVAVSGGEDSMVLLDAVSKAASIIGFSFFVINIEHGIRGDSSLSDSAFVKDYCDKNGIEFCGSSVKAKEYSKDNGLTLEEGARILRYRVFDSLLADGKCTRVLLAHHATDQAETVLMRIIRGTGITGLQGIREVSGGYVRPLLDVSKEDIGNYRRKYNIPFITDESNFDNDYTRNLLRNQVFPLLGKISVDAVGALNRLARIAAENEEFVSSFERDIETGDNYAAMDINADEQKLLFKRRARKCFAALGVMKDIEERHLELLYGLTSLNNGAHLDMPYGVCAIREYDKIVFTRKTQKSNLTIPFSIGRIIFDDITINILPYDGNKLNKGVTMFDADKIPDGAIFRSRRDGDVFTKFGGGTKSLGDYMTDKKIPLRVRDNVVVLAKNNEVLLIAGYEISDKIKVDDKNKKSIYTLTAED